MSLSQIVQGLSIATNAVKNFGSNVASNISSGWNTFNAVRGAGTIGGLASGMLQIGSAFIGGISAMSVYNHYDKAAKAQVSAAVEEARRLQLRGDIALANLKVKHALSQGGNELAAAGAGGRLSGSTLEALTANYKYNVRDERAQDLETIWAVSDAKRRGYIGAANTMGSAEAYAISQRTNMLSAAAGALSSIAEGYARDYGAWKKNQSQLNQLDMLLRSKLDANADMYNVPPTIIDTTSGGGVTDYSTPSAVYQTIEDTLKIETDPVTSGTPTRLFL